jgi:UDP-N-acetylmuramate: L-alanyl-gamma-D-glutamyl-meso-diaminopimelate ligase
MHNWDDGMKIHILGICGTFMGGVAAIAKTLGHQVSGSDQNVYPPMSDQLAQLGIDIHQGYTAKPLQDDGLDQVIVGNVMTRGMPATEYLLEASLSYVSGPGWLGEQVLRHKQVYAVAGTHGKTTTASMLAWILEDNGVDPGFLIGGVCHHFAQSARLTGSDAFVIEADEYDSAFFDKRSKFVHYHSDVVILNNLEFDHADIFKDLDAIKTQFHHLVRTIPQNGKIVVNGDDKNLQAVMAMGCWTPVVTFGSNNQSDYWVVTDEKNPRQFSIHHQSGKLAEIDWSITGQHNQLNALAAILAAKRAGVSIRAAADSLSRFQNVKRRMELIGEAGGVHIYDDFAHHPTAIETTLSGLKAVSSGRTIAVLEPRSNSMRAGAHAEALPAALSGCDQAYVMIYPELAWDERIKAQLAQQCIVLDSVDNLLARLKTDLKANDQVVFMSNGSFADAPRRLLGLLSD